MKKNIFVLFGILVMANSACRADFLPTEDGRDQWMTDLLVKYGLVKPKSEQKPVLCGQDEGDKEIIETIMRELARTSCS